MKQTLDKAGINGTLQLLMTTGDSRLSATSEIVEGEEYDYVEVIFKVKLDDNLQEKDARI